MIIYIYILFLSTFTNLAYITYRLLVRNFANLRSKQKISGIFVKSIILAFQRRFNYHFTLIRSLFLKIFITELRAMNLVYSLEQLSTASRPLQVSGALLSCLSLPSNRNQRSLGNLLHHDNGYCFYHDITTTQSQL